MGQLALLLISLISLEGSRLVRILSALPELSDLSELSELLAFSLPNGNYRPTNAQAQVTPLNPKLSLPATTRDMSIPESGRELHSLVSLSEN